MITQNYHELKSQIQNFTVLKKDQDLECTNYFTITAKTS